MDGECSIPGNKIKETQAGFEKLPSTAFVFSNDGVLLTDTHHRILDVNPAFEQITGYHRDEIVGLTPKVLSSGVHPVSFYQTMSSDLNEKGAWSGDIWNRHKDGSVYLENLAISVVPDRVGQPAYYLGMIRDVTEQRLYKDKLRNEALYDPLTSLPNRKFLAQSFEKAIVQAQINNRKMAIFFLDLDGFKKINDSLGHDIGDKVLIEIARNFKLCLRDEDLIARLGGDEFAGYILNLEEQTDCFPVLHRILIAASEPLKIHSHHIALSASIGVTFYPQNNVLDGDQLLRQADFAMYQAKQKGKNNFHIFDQDNEVKQTEYNAVLEDLATGISRNELILYYQPKLNMATNALTGVEALVRWRHPEKGLLSPAHFLPMIEEHWLSIELGYWVIENALKQISSWLEQGLRIPVSINITSKHIHQDDFIANILQLLTVYPNVDRELIELEIVESSALYDIDKVVEVIQRCRQLGIAVSLDDFGSGYSSLPYLRKLPVSKLKIDRSFTHNILTSTADLSIIEAVMALAKAFHCQVIVEGVENEEQGLLLLKLGCVEAQGFFIARPMPPTQLIQWYTERSHIPSWEAQQPLEQESLLLTYAIVEHRGWMEKVKLYIQGKNVELPELNHEKCLFSVWYDRSSSLFKNTSMDSQIVSIHKSIHLKAKEVISVQDAVEGAYIESEIQQLETLSEEFLGLLSKS